MIATCKKLVTDIQRKKDPGKDIPEYISLLKQQYNCYATVKGCMNYYTMKEVCEEQQDADMDVCRYYETLTQLLDKHICKQEAVSQESLDVIDKLRDKVEYKMHILTAFTDGYELYEYVLNRVEASVTGVLTPVDASDLSEKMFRYVFSEDDTVVVNSKLQLLMGQLPVRMTKNKFLDILANTLKIYEGGEIRSVDEFADMLRSTILLKKPEGFETEYPFLYQVYHDLEEADYAALNQEQFEDLTNRLQQAADIINNEASAFMLLQETINDIYTILLTKDGSYEKNWEAVPGYVAACKIIQACVPVSSTEELPESIMDAFFTIEGVQERIYEGIMILETIMDDIRLDGRDVIVNAQLEEDWNRLEKASMLLSTSLFVDLQQTQEGTGVADHEYITQLQNSLSAQMKDELSSRQKKVSRGMMSKLLAAMPIFMNTQQEIKDYFDYVIQNCKDDSELIACNKLICEIIEE